MFESICIRRQRPFGDPLDLGFLAEALVFYGSVHVVADDAILKYLIQGCGYEALSELLQRKKLAITYMESVPLIMTVGQGTPQERHEPELGTWDRIAFQNIVPAVLQEIVGKSGKARRMALRLSSMISAERYPQSLVDEAKQDFLDITYFQDVLVSILRELAPEFQIPDRPELEVIPDGRGVRVRTNIDFAHVNRSYHKHVLPELSSLSIAYLLALLIDARADLYFSAKLTSDIALSRTHSIAASKKIQRIVDQRSRRQDTVDVFEEFLLGKAGSIREAVNSGTKTFQDVLELIEAAERFVGWVKNQPEDADLRKEYCRELAQVGWAARLPAKTLRWLIFTGTGALVSTVTDPVTGTAAGAALGAADTFLVDHLVKGWKPNQFVEGPLRKFVGLDSERT